MKVLQEANLSFCFMIYRRRKPHVTALAVQFTMHGCDRRVYWPQRMNINLSLNLNNQNTNLLR